MSRALRWGLGLLLVGGLLLGAFLFLPFRDWLPGGTVGDIAKREVVNGTAFNRLFPKPEIGQQLVFTQEKRGFSEARLKRGDEVLALLAISDTTTAPAARAKYSGSSAAIQGWPLVDQGQQVSGLLVAERFQVKVIGQGNGLSADQRHELLEAFDLKGLAAIAPALKGERQGTARALPPGNQQPVRLPGPRVGREAPESAPANAPNRRPSAVLEPAA
jgi:hypothetical protein